AYRLFFRRFILNDVPMLDKDSVLDAHNICGNPIHRSTETAKSSVHDNEVSFSHDRSWFVFQGWWDAFDEIEQTLTTRCDMSALFFSCLVRLIECFLLVKPCPPLIQSVNLSSGWELFCYFIYPLGIEPNMPPNRHNSRKRILI